MLSTRELEKLRQQAEATQHYTQVEKVLLIELLDFYEAHQGEPPPLREPNRVLVLRNQTDD